MKIRYAITHINEDGYRQLAFANQGRNHFDDRDSAKLHLEMTLKHNNEKILKSVYGPPKGRELKKTALKEKR